MKNLAILMVVIVGVISFRSVQANTLELLGESKHELASGLFTVISVEVKLQKETAIVTVQNVKHKYLAKIALDLVPSQN